MFTCAGHGRIGVGVVCFWWRRRICQRRWREGEEDKDRGAEGTTAKGAI